MLFISAVFLILSLNNISSAQIPEYPFEPIDQVRLEVLVSERSLSNVSTIFSNLNLRMKYTDKNKGSQDLVLSFTPNDGADNQSPSKQALKTLFFGYDTVLNLENMDYFVRRSFAQRATIIHRYILNSSDEIIKNLFVVLRSAANSQIQLKSFSLLNQSGASTLYEQLGHIGYFINKNYSWSSVAPVTVFNFVGNAMYPVLLGLVELPPIQSSLKYLQNLEKKLGYTLDSVEGVDRLLAQLNIISVQDLNILLNLDLPNLKGKRFPLLRELKNRGGKYYVDNSQELFNYKDYPGMIYEMCLDELCAQRQAQIFKNIYSPIEIKTLRALINSEIVRSQNLIFGPSLKNTNQFQHARLLLQYL